MRFSVVLGNEWGEVMDDGRIVSLGNGRLSSSSRYMPISFMNSSGLEYPLPPDVY